MQPSQTLELKTVETAGGAGKTSSNEPPWSHLVGARQQMTLGLCAGLCQVASQGQSGFQKDGHCSGQLYHGKRNQAAIPARWSMV